MRLLDIVMHYDCNLACDYCTITPLMRTRSLQTTRMASALKTARGRGVTEVQFTGGEPTLRSDLLALLRYAKQLGYDRIVVQTNGLLLTRTNLSALEQAGVTEVLISIHTHLQGDYDAMVRRPGAFELMRAGLKRASASQLQVKADLIMTKETAPRLADAVRFLAAHKIEAARLWLVSLTDGNAENPESLLPFSELAPFVHKAFEAAQESGVVLHSLHLPLCVLGPHAAQAVDPAEGGVRLLTPDDELDLSEAKLTPGTYPEVCAPCVHRGGACGGLRNDYLQTHGAAGLTPVLRDAD